MLNTLETPSADAPLVGVGAAEPLPLPDAVPDGDVPDGDEPEAVPEGEPEPVVDAGATLEVGAAAVPGAMTWKLWLVA